MMISGEILLPGSDTLGVVTVGQLINGCDASLRTFIAVCGSSSAADFSTFPLLVVKVCGFDSVDSFEPTGSKSVPF